MVKPWCTDPHYKPVCHFVFFLFCCNCCPSHQWGRLMIGKITFDPINNLLFRRARHTRQDGLIRGLMYGSWISKLRLSACQKSCGLWKNMKSSLDNQPIKAPRRYDTDASWFSASQLCVHPPMNRISPKKDRKNAGRSCLVSNASLAGGGDHRAGTGPAKQAVGGELRSTSWRTNKMGELKPTENSPTLKSRLIGRVINILIQKTNKSEQSS